MNSARLGIGMLGLGTVGTGVVNLLAKNRDLIAKKTGLTLDISKVLVRNPSKHRPGLSPMLDPATIRLVTDPKEVLEDSGISVVIEVMGGVDPTKEYVVRALVRGKHVVTANKDLMADHGREVFEAAESGRSGIYFEASVGAGIPIIRPLKECLVANRVTRVMGILNGTTNYILTSMEHAGLPFSEALRQAQEKGYAEPDPTSDIEGLDTARKLAILASIAFGARITTASIPTLGISSISAEDIIYGKELGWTPKLLGIAKEADGLLDLYVGPTFLPLSHPLASVQGAFNAISVVGDAVGEVVFHGQGAGALPTASAILGDVVEAARRIANGTPGPHCSCHQDLRLRPPEESSGEYYLRMEVDDKPGVLAQLAGAMAMEYISLHSVIQKRATGDSAEVVFVTHEAPHGAIVRAQQRLQGLPSVRAIKTCIRVYANSEENIST